MEYYIIVTLLLTIVYITFIYKTFSKSKVINPPGPRPWPIIGNMLLLDDKPHRVVAKLSRIYGPIMSLKLGSLTTIVISSPEIAKEMFVKHDLDFSSRIVQDAVRALNHEKVSLVWLPVSPKWREIRKILALQLFTTHRLNESQDIRHKKVKELVDYVQQCCEAGQAVDIGKAGFTTVLNLLSNTFFSMDFASHSSSGLQEFKELVRHFMEEIGRPNVSDFFPLIRWLDLQGVLKRSRRNYTKSLDIFQKIIDERLRDPNAPKDDVLATLLKLIKDNNLSLDEVKHLLVDLFAAGTDTTSSTLEWAMTELLRNPEKMAKAQIEIDQIIGKNGTIQESEILKLPYIQAIVKETFRLHPPAPFLVPHKANNNVEICGCFVPKNAQIWVNVWSIGRDPSVWPNPLVFSPERFLERETDVKGGDFELIPFGAGRRICPGMPLANRMVHLMLAILLQSFNWKFHGEVSSIDIDMEEKFGLTLQKAKPLEAIPSPR
ncbi:cytochrome P450 76AD1-like [Chenopodium quinoa]|uniref:cytochrome P450 76AD1-like n=1 Tax=Chenopodium quinoa TaxID=63459 RepID=UPI000B78EE7D|nr:cytochrome P450 76AD1-like [Chenopodium quinoa]